MKKKNLLTEASSKSAETISNPLFWATSLLTLGSKQNKQQKSVNTWKLVSLIFRRSGNPSHFSPEIC